VIPPGHHGAVILMVVTGALLLAGIALTWRWGGVGYRTWSPTPTPPPWPEAEPGGDPAPPPTARTVVLRYWRGAAVAIVGGFWAGALVTGPAIRLIMRLLAVTAGDGAQGRITEADEVVGSINLDGTVSLVVFGGILPGLLSGVIYVVVRRWLPAGRLGGVTFGALHLVVAATRIDPLRPGNPDFDLVGPAWLSVTAFGIACILHGMAVVAFADRYSRALPPPARTRAAWAWAVVPLVLPALLMVAGIALLALLVVGMAVAVLATRIGPLVRTLRSHAALVAGRLAIGLVAVALLPGAVIDVHDVIVRDDAGTVTSGS
jgi:hypothetical protein